MFAIQNIKTGKFLYGTDYNYSPPQQRTSKHNAKIYDNLAHAKMDFINRKCGRNYRIVSLKPLEVLSVIRFDKSNTYEWTATDWGDCGG